MNFKYYKSEKLLIFIIAQVLVFGALATWIHHLSASWISPFKELVFFTDSFTVPFFIGLTLYLVNNFGWKTNYFKWLVDIPNLNGRYTGKLISNYTINGVRVEMDCVLEIKQSASSIHISGYFGNITEGTVSSSSFSVSEELFIERSGFYRLYYVFSNETGALSERLNNHSGTARFLYFPDKYSLEGEYYNKINNTGSIIVSYQQDTLLGRLIP